MSNKSRGNAFEIKVRKYLEGLGWTIDKARPTIKWIAPGRCISGPNDFFGCADLIGVHPKKGYTLIVQNTISQAVIAAKKKKIETIPWNLQAQRVLIWTRDDRIKGLWRVYRLFETHPDSAPGPYWSETFFKSKDRVPEDLL